MQYCVVPAEQCVLEGLADAAGINFLRLVELGFDDIRVPPTHLQASKQATAMQPMSGFGQREREGEREREEEAPTANTLTARLIASTVLSQSDRIADRIA